MGRTPTQIIKMLQRFKYRIEKKYDVKKMLLFGSQARGEAKEGSDVDLIIVSPQFKGKKALPATVNLYKEWHIRERAGLPVDFLCYSPDEFKKLKNTISIVSQAIKEGVEI